MALLLIGREVEIYIRFAGCVHAAGLLEHTDFAVTLSTELPEAHFPRSKADFVTKKAKQN